MPGYGLVKGQSGYEGVRSSSVTTKNVIGKKCPLCSLKYILKGVHCWASFILLSKFRVRY